MLQLGENSINNCSCSSLPSPQIIWGFLFSVLHFEKRYAILHTSKATEQAALERQPTADEQEQTKWKGESVAGNKAGGLKAKITNLERYGKDFYRNIGRRGGQNGRTGGFYANRELARIAGAKGGRISKRGPAKRKDDNV